MKNMTNIFNEKVLKITMDEFINTSPNSKWITEKLGINALFIHGYACIKQTDYERMRDKMGKDWAVLIAPDDVWKALSEKL
jgi:hypothetical protein